MVYSSLKSCVGYGEMSALDVTYSSGLRGKFPSSNCWGLSAVNCIQIMTYNYMVLFISLFFPVKLLSLLIVSVFWETSMLLFLCLLTPLMIVVILLKELLCSKNYTFLFEFQLLSLFNVSPCTTCFLKSSFLSTKII